MTKVKIFLVLLGFFLVLMASSCRKFEEYPPEPQIEYQNFKLLVNPTTGKVEKGRLSISYRDGDGDIGLDQTDTLPPYNISGDFYYNFVLRFYEKQHGQFVEIPGFFSGRIPPLIPKNQKKSIKGIIEYDLDVVNETSSYDTIQFRVKLIDRALHISNEVISPEFVRKLPQ